MNNINIHFHIILPSMYVCAKWILSFCFPHQAYAVLFCTTSATCPAYLIARNLISLIMLNGRSQWPRGLRRWSAAARLLRLWVRIPPGGMDVAPAEIMGSNPTGGMDVCCECCVLSGRGVCDELITRLEQCFSTFVRPRPGKFFFIRRGPGPNRFTRKYLSIFFLIRTLN